MTTHGTMYAYRKGCRCDDCRERNNSAARRWRASAAGKSIPQRAHGTVNGYKIYGCRCEPCKAARSASDAAHRERRQRVATLALAGLPADWEGDI